MCRLSLNMGASTSWNPQGLSGSVLGLICLKIWECEATCYHAWSEGSGSFRFISFPQVSSAISLVCREADSDPLVITQSPVFLTSSRQATQHLYLIRTTLEYSHYRRKITKYFHRTAAFCTGLRFAWFVLVMQTNMFIVIRVITNRQLIFAWCFVSRLHFNPSAWSDGHCPHAARSHSFVFISTS